MDKQKIPSGLSSDIPNLRYDKLGSVSPESSGSGCGRIIAIVFGILIVIVLITLAVPPQSVRIGSRVRAKVARVQADLRSIATALETYYVDNNEYPAMTKEGELSLQTLTSPVAYLSDHSYVTDSFSKDSKQMFGYLYDKKQGRYILVSNGPDMDRDITWDLIRENVDLEKTEDLKAFLESLTYDPTNGITSDGDIVRMQRIIP